MKLLVRARQYVVETWRRRDPQFAGAVPEFSLFSLRHSPLWRSLMFHVWDYPFTRPGKLMIAAFFFSSLPGAITDEVPMYMVPVTLLAVVLMVSGMGSVFRWAKVEVTARLPERIHTGQTLSIVLTARNVCWLPIYDVSAACFSPPGSWTPIRDDSVCRSLPPGKSVDLVVQLVAGRRGLYQLPPLRVFSTFPFNLFRNEVGRTLLKPVLVLPDFPELPRLTWHMGDRYQPGGLSLMARVGESPEYVGNREYQPGDALRRIDFRSWARLARPVVKEYHDELNRRVALVLDTFVPPGPRYVPRLKSRSPSAGGGIPAVEAAISLTAAIADMLVREETQIQLLVTGPQMHVFDRFQHQAQIEHLLEILATVDPTRSKFEMVHLPLVSEFSRLSAVIFVMLDWDEPRRQLVRLAKDAGCHLRMLIVRDGKTSEPLDEALRGVTQTLTLRAAVAGEL